MAKFKPHADYSVSVYSDHLEGYAWAENIGWIKLNGTAINAAAYKVKMTVTSTPTPTPTPTPTHGPGPGPGPAPLPATLLVSPAVQNVVKETGTTSFTVSNSGGVTMNWTAAVTSGGSWLSITSGSSGTNSGAITCSYTANTSTATRSGVIRVTATGATNSPTDVTVIQADSGTPVLSVAPGNRDVNKAAESTTFAVSNTGTGTMKWVSQVTSGNTWLEITSSTTGTDSGTITCSFTANTSATSRTGSIRVTAVDAAGNPRVITDSPRNITINQIVHSGIVSNAIGAHNLIKISDLSGDLPADGANINVRAWDANGAELTSTPSGLVVDSAKFLIQNVKAATRME